MKSEVVKEEVLLTVLWAADKLSKPTLRNLLESDRTWEYRTRLRHSLRRLEQDGLVRQEKRATTIVMRVTGTGRLAALGGCDLERRWNRPWDGQWRMVLFDLPARQTDVRKRLWRWLRDNRFGYLQQSVWIHPDPVPTVLEALKEFQDDVESFTIMEARRSAGATDKAIVRGAWDFTEINKRYDTYLSALKPSVSRPDNLSAWLRQEHVAWHHALSIDPFLPRALLPDYYKGIHAWNARRETLAKKIKQSLHER